MSEERAQRDWEYYTTRVPVERQIPKALFKQLPPGRPPWSKRDEDDEYQHEVFNSSNFPTPYVSQNVRISYTSQIYDYPRK
jgi:hypothetical protein